MAADFRYALRILLKNPIFTLAAVITLALGIGANTTIFSLIDSFLLRPLPVPQPYRLARISTLGRSGHEAGLSIPMFEEFQRDQTVFQSMFAWFGNGVNNVEANGTPFSGDVDQVTGDYYATLGVSPLLGRVISPKDDGLPVAVISYECWKTHYAGDPAILGKPIQIEDKSYTIIG
ncbi:MAG TPA: ABC transporter permease, partial [Bryobacteraceae bacterium]|nr:ABC transporter permease [Bryobacteraceae bacterium]